MKKLMTALTVCAVASYAIAATNVVSQNVVGYKADVSVASNNYTMLAAPFTLVGGGDQPIASLFADNSGFTPGYAEQDSDVIYVWTGSGYDTYIYSLDAGNKWASDQDPGTETTATIPAGGAFWFLRLVGGPALNTLTIVGEVIKTDIVVAVASNNYTMVGNPFPAELPIASITAPDLTPGYAEQDSDVIYVWTGSGYDTYIYSLDAGNKWASDQDPGTETTATIPADGAFWFLRLLGGAATSLTLPVPYVL